MCSIAKRHRLAVSPIHRLRRLVLRLARQRGVTPPSVVVHLEEECDHGCDPQVIVIDNSVSMRTRRAQVETAALVFARASNPLDELFVVNFADTPHLDVPFTTDVGAVAAGIAKADAVGGTALRDCVDLGERYLRDHAKRDRKALLVITDGNDNASAVPTAQIRQQAEQGNVAIYVIALPHDDVSKAARARRELDDLTERTGGVAVHVAQMNDVEATALVLAHQIRQQYTLAYAPLNQVLDGLYRKIHVAVHSRERRVSVRTQAGYLATAGPGAAELKEKQ